MADTIPYASMFEPLKIGDRTMKNRFVVPPLTRCRAGTEHMPNEMMAKYYEARASYGLIIAEATMVQPGYSTFGFEPGIFSEEQVSAWRLVTDAVHARDGVIYLQLHHGGRSTVPANLTTWDKKIVGASRHGILNHACPAPFAADETRQPYPDPVHYLQVTEIKALVQLFTEGATNAMAAGFDGVEIHGANGYLIDQFLRTSSNSRVDEYGGSLENRTRLFFEVIDAVCAAIGKEHVAVRISLLNLVNDMADSDPEALTRYLCSKLNPRKIAFLDVIRGNFYPTTEAEAAPEANCSDVWARESYKGVLISGMAYTADEAAEAVASEKVDAVCFGRLSMANPDLPWRLANAAEMNPVDVDTFYTHDAEGYIDYRIVEPVEEGQHKPAAAVDAREPSRASTSRARAHCHSIGHEDNVYDYLDGPVSTMLMPLVIGSCPMKNRAVMGPLPRQRATVEGHLPNEHMARYYSDRARFGLIISEPCEIEEGYNTYVQSPGIYNKAQAEAWKSVTDAVHAKGGFMFCQLHHGGRAVLPCNIELPNGAAASALDVFGPCACPIDEDALLCHKEFTKSGKAESYSLDVTPMRGAKIDFLVNAYARCAKDAVATGGFDGVEIQAGNGYLIDQFLRTSSNDRVDEYGGSMGNRCRFLLEVVDAVVAAVGKDRVGLRISPSDNARGMSDEDPEGLTEYIASAMHARRIAYIMVATGDRCEYCEAVDDACEPAAWARRFFKGVVMVDDNTEIQVAEANIAARKMDAASFTFLAVSNPDFVDRVLRGREVNEPDVLSLFTHDPLKGYNDYNTRQTTLARPRSTMPAPVATIPAKARSPFNEEETASAAAPSAEPMERKEAPEEAAAQDAGIHLDASEPPHDEHPIDDFSDNEPDYYTPSENEHEQNHHYDPNDADYGDDIYDGHDSYDKEAEQPGEGAAGKPGASDMYSCEDENWENDTEERNVPNGSVGASAESFLNTQ